MFRFISFGLQPPYILFIYLAFQSYVYERNWWRLFQTHVVYTKLDIYGFITITTASVGWLLVSDGLALKNLIQPTISLEMPVPSQGHYGFHSFPVVDWFCLFIYLWVLTFPL
jgi:hypothetical protein